MKRYRIKFESTFDAEEAEEAEARLVALRDHSCREVGLRFEYGAAEEIQPWRVWAPVPGSEPIVKGVRAPR